MFAVQTDTTQDLTSKDQYVSALRYVSNAVHEGVIATTDCELSTAQYFNDLVKHTLEKMDMDVKQCAGNAIDRHNRDNTVATPHCVVYSKSLKTGCCRLRLKDEALRRLFGSFAKPDDAQYAGVFIKDALLSYETYRLRIFRRDTCGIEPATAHSSVPGTEVHLTKFAST